MAADEMTTIGLTQLGIDEFASSDQQERQTIQLIARSLMTRRLVCFVGSGASRAYGRPSWNDAIFEIVLSTAAALEKTGAREYVDSARRLRQWASNCVPLDGAMRQSDRGLALLGECEALSQRLQLEFPSVEAPDVRRIMVGDAGRGLAPDEPVSDPEADPLAKIIGRWNVRRFLTLNYDLCIEHAFKRSRGWLSGQGGPLQGAHADVYSPLVRSLSVGESDPDELLMFAAGVPGYDTGVLHCHGRLDATGGKSAELAGNQIVIEADYQRVYLSDNRYARGYRQALEAAFAANPVMFVGVGMTEPDVLRPLRYFCSQEIRHGRRRPIFALMPMPRVDAGKIEAALQSRVFADRTPEQVRADLVDAAAHELRQFLLRSYGVRVVFFGRELQDLGRGMTTNDLSRALCKKVDEIAEARESWWKDWLHKPPARKPSFHIVQSPSVMCRHPLTTDRRIVAVKSQASFAKRVLSSGPTSLVVLAWPGGARGSAFNALAGNDDLPQYFERCFFATTRSSHEFLSVLQGAVAHFGMQSRPGETVLQTLARAVRDQRVLLAVCGFERLLRRVSHDPDRRARPLERIVSDVVSDHHGQQSLAGFHAGEPDSTDVDDFLNLMEEIAAHPTGYQGSIVIASSLVPVRYATDRRRFGWPSGRTLDVDHSRPIVGDRESASGLEVRVMEGLEASDLGETGWSTDDRRELCEILRGHTYALTLIHRAVERSHSGRESV